MTPVWEAAMHAKAVLNRIEERLIAGGGVVELAQMAGLSSSEMDLRERHETRVDVPDGFVLVSTAYDPPDEPEPVNEYGTPLGLALEDQSIRDEEKADRG